LISIGSLKKARPESLRSFYYAHNSRSESLIKARLEKFAAALPITEDSAVIEPLAFVTKMLLGTPSTVPPKVSLPNLHEFAGESIPRSEWAKTFYQSQRKKGKSHHSAVRMLAFKWIRVIFRCWKSHQPYNEAFYLDALKKRQKNN
jgi:hypothetical protein